MHAQHEPLLRKIGKGDMEEKTSYTIFPVGIIHRSDNVSSIEIFNEYQDALQGLDQFSHIIILSWFHENDKEEKRKTLRVYPRGDRKNPLTGVFATRSPIRPNLVAFFTSRIISIKGNIIKIEDINALEGSPVIDIKPYIPYQDCIQNAVTPEWLKRK
ncbi:tRNA (N6-threonylcarbamoyladenosine(37)-N6)-methyltransferase TrmO [Thermodesulfobacteriota bacterium]